MTVRNEERVKAEGLYRKHHNLNQDDRFQRDVDGKSQSKPPPTAVTTGADSHPHTSRGITYEEEDQDQDAFFYFNRTAKHRSRSSSSSSSIIIGGVEDSISEDEHYTNQYDSLA